MFRLLKRRSIRVTAGPDIVQVRRIERFPLLRGSARRARHLEANVSAFFLRTSDALVVTGPVSTPAGETWAAAYDRTALDAIEQSARERGMRLSCVVPAPELIPPEFRTHRFTARTPLAWYPARSASIGKRTRIAIAATAIVSLLAATTAAIVAPSIRHDQFVRASRAELDARHAEMMEAARIRAELARTSRQLSEIGAFADSRDATAALVARISDAIPDSSAIVTLRIDPAEGSVTSLTADIASLLAGLANIPGLSSVRVTGALTSEMAGATRLQRATVRFRRSAVRK